MAFQLISIPLTNRAGPADYRQPHSASGALVGAGGGAPGFGEGRGGRPLPTTLAPPLPRVFSTTPHRFLLQIKAAICCDKCSHSPFPSYLPPRRDAQCRGAALRPPPRSSLLSPSGVCPLPNLCSLPDGCWGARGAWGGSILACSPLRPLSCELAQRGVSRLLRGHHLGD